jgi:hypothetical protein
MRALFFAGIWVAGAAALDILAVEDEEDALALVKSASFDVKTIAEREVAGLIKRQWLEAAEAVILLSHEKSVDLSKHVREVVKQQRQKLDALVQKLDPKHAEIQRVSPAFQWAQNASAVFLQIKYASRWNAPGSLDLKPVNVTFNATRFVLDGMGAHSGVTKRYVLDLPLMDYIDQERSFWQTASVGKMTVTIIKLHAGKIWPRLLLDKTKKIQNMGVWSSIQEKQKESTPCHNTAASCALKSQLYCVKKDKCVQSCSSCEDSELDSSTPEYSRCVGKPGGPSLSDLKDNNGEKGKWTGSFTVTVTDESEAKELCGYVSAKHTATEVDKELDATDGSAPDPLIRIPLSGMETYQFNLKNIAIDNHPNLVFYTVNAMKRRSSPTMKQFSDAAVPAAAPDEVLVDYFWRKMDGNVSARVTIVPPNENSTLLDAFIVYAGKSATVRANRKVLQEVKKPEKGGNVTQNVTFKVPTSATHLHFVSKNTHGESNSLVAVALPVAGYEADGVLSEPENPEL